MIVNRHNKIKNRLTIKFLKQFTLDLATHYSLTDKIYDNLVTDCSNRQMVQLAIKYSLLHNAAQVLIAKSSRYLFYSHFLNLSVWTLHIHIFSFVIYN